jgi:hypothetical protein
MKNVTPIICIYFNFYISVKNKFNFKIKLTMWFHCSSNLGLDPSSFYLSCHYPSVCIDTHICSHTWTHTHIIPVHICYTLFHTHKYPLHCNLPYLLHAVLSVSHMFSKFSFSWRILFHTDLYWTHLLKGGCPRTPPVPTSFFSFALYLSSSLICITF